MRLGLIPLAVWAVVSLSPGVAAAQPERLTLGDALSRAREQAPRIVSARLALEEARGRLAGAGVRFQNNPELDMAAGRRRGETASTDFELGIQQQFEPAGRRSARIAAANEGVAQGTAIIDETTRLVMRDTASAFLRAVHAAERVRLLATTEEMAAQILAAADRRFKAGDIAVLDVNLARAAVGRARSDKQGALAAQAIAIGELKQLLGIDREVTIEGTLRPPAEPDVDALLQASSQRPELRELEAAAREAEAQVRLGRTYGKPELGVAARYEREEGDNILLGGITISIPRFARGQELLSVGAARTTRLRADLEAARTRVRIEVQAGAETYRRRVDAVRALEAEALTGLDENERLTTRSFEVGQLGLAELLFIRREILDTRFQYLDTLLEAALAQIDLHASAAILR
ncbi:MAG: TolC family protein [Acidobacteria bacterium]|nr:TolC family protein [Acidobacteriota bacterium]